MLRNTFSYLCTWLVITLSLHFKQETKELHFNKDKFINLFLQHLCFWQLVKKAWNHKITFSILFWRLYFCLSQVFTQSGIFFLFNMVWSKKLFPTPSGCASNKSQHHLQKILFPYLMYNTSSVTHRISMYAQFRFLASIFLNHLFVQYYINSIIKALSLKIG